MSSCAYVVEHTKVTRAEQSVASQGTVVQNTQIWDHHFPEFPILPGVLALDLLKATAEKWYDSKLQVRSVQRVRFSNYLKPGAEWQVQMRLESLSSEGDRWSGEIFSAGVKMVSAILTLMVKG